MKKLLKKDDLVEVITGADKKKSGKILKVNLKNNKVIVQGINIKKKTIKKTDKDPGKIIEIEKEIHQSNVKKNRKNLWAQQNKNIMKL